MRGSPAYLTESLTRPAFEMESPRVEHLCKRCYTAKLIYGPFQEIFGFQGEILCYLCKPIHCMLSWDLKGRVKPDHLSFHHIQYLQLRAKALQLWEDATTQQCSFSFEHCTLSSPSSSQSNWFWECIHTGLNPVQSSSVGSVGFGNVSAIEHEPEMACESTGKKKKVQGFFFPRNPVWFALVWKLFDRDKNWMWKNIDGRGGGNHTMVKLNREWGQPGCFWTCVDWWWLKPSSKVDYLCHGKVL